MKTREFVRLLGIGVVWLGCAFLLLPSISGIGWAPFWAWILFSFGILLVGEPGIWSWGRREFYSFSGDEPLRKAAETARRGTTRGLIEIALLVIAAYSLFFFSRAQALHQDRQGQTKIQFSDSIERELTKFLATPPQIPGGKNTASAQIDPELKGILLEILKKPQTPASNRSGWDTVLPVTQTVILALIAGLVFLLVVRKHPSAAPVVGAAELAFAAIKNSDHLSKLGGNMFWALIITYLVITTVCLGVALGIHRLRARGDETKSPESNREGSPLAMVFSLVVLVWTLVLVVYRPEPTKEIETHVNHPVQASRPDPVTHLHPVPTFGKSVPSSLSDDLPKPKEVEQLEQDLRAATPERGDVLLLLGSADCTPFRSDKKKENNTNDANKKLAERRAETVRRWLEPTAQNAGVFVWSEALPQHSMCKEASDLRGVYSFLIRSGSIVH